MHHYFLALAFAVLSQSIHTSAFAQANASVERQKARVVSRMYQATYGAQDLCQSSKEGSAKLGKAIEQLRNAFPELMRLIDGSPYLVPAKEQFKEILDDTTTKPNAEALIQECTGIASMLLQFVESPGGRQAADDMIQTLKK